MENKYFKCFKCHFHNNAHVPFHFKGLKCRRCHVFNYFNYIKRRRENNRRNNNRNINIQRNLPPIDFSMIRINYITDDTGNNLLRNESINNNNPIRIRQINNNNILRNNNNENFSFQIQNNNLFPSIHNINNNFENYFHDLFLNNFIINSHRPVIRNTNSLNNNNEISWLKKEKFTQNIIKKYGKDNICSICLEDINAGNIHISKCNHIFHYKCIKECINRNIVECPNCRANLRTGVKKRVENINNLRYDDFNIFNNERNIRRESSRLIIEEMEEI